MLKKLFCLILCAFALFCSVGYNQIVFADEEKIYLGGQAVGFSISTEGAYIVGICDVITENGLRSPAKDAGLQSGDVLLSINDRKVNNAKDIEDAVLSENQVIIGIKRYNEIIFTTLKPAKDVNNRYKLGVYVKDDMSGIGTITFIKGNRFASLGHPILDENDSILSVSSGYIYNCNITGYVKGVKGRPGELRGVIDKKSSLGMVEKNLECGVFGLVKRPKPFTNLKEIKIGKAKMGNAYIYSTISGQTVKKYSISIVKVEEQGETKNFVVKITDKELLENTGGIVQGMSGSPIVQDGKLVGAVTHVFINDPTRGFGISIQNMLNR